MSLNIPFFWNEGVPKLVSHFVKIQGKFRDKQTEPRKIEFFKNHWRNLFEIMNLDCQHIFCSQNKILGQSQYVCIHNSTEHEHLLSVVHVHAHNWIILRICLGNRNFEVDFLPPLIFLELNIVIFGNIIFKCPSVTEKMLYFTAHIRHSRMSTKFKLFFSHSKTPCNYGMHCIMIPY